MATEAHWNRFVIRIVTLFVVIGGIATAIFYTQQTEILSQHEMGEVQPSGAKNQARLQFYEGLGGDFTLTNHHGARMNLRDYQGKVILLNFGYTNCPDICPMILSRLKVLMKKLGNPEDRVQTLFITFDPERDTAQHLKNYLAHFDPAFVGLTGTPEEITKVTKQYGAAYVSQQVESKAEYFFAHSDYVYLIDKKGNLRTFYHLEVSLDEMLADIQTLLAAQ